MLEPSRRLLISSERIIRLILHELLKIAKLNCYEDMMTQVSLKYQLLIKHRI